MILLILLIMIFCHIIEDFHIQGILSDLKQYHWWINHEGFEHKYQNDYLVGLFVHGYEWAFCMMLPILIYRWNNWDINGIISYAIVLIVNGLIHSFIDNLKANKHITNLIQDQCCHFTQIFITFGLFAFDII